MLNTTPLSSHRTFAGYANFLNMRYVLPNFAKCAKEVHILQDDYHRPRNLLNANEEICRLLLL